MCKAGRDSSIECAYYRTSIEHLPRIHKNPGSITSTTSIILIIRRIKLSWNLLGQSKIRDNVI